MRASLETCDKTPLAVKSSPPGGQGATGKLESMLT
jgi:hypothetical protein